MVLDELNSYDLCTGISLRPNDNFTFAHEIDLVSLNNPKNNQNLNMIPFKQKKQLLFFGSVFQHPTVISSRWF